MVPCSRTACGWLGDEASIMCCQHGQATPLEEAIAYALETDTTGA